MPMRADPEARCFSKEQTKPDPAPYRILETMNEKSKQLKSYAFKANSSVQKIANTSKEKHP